MLGEGLMVENYESNLGRRNFNRGHHARGGWVFGWCGKGKW